MLYQIDAVAMAVIMAKNPMTFTTVLFPYSGLS